MSKSMFRDMFTVVEGNSSILDVQTAFAGGVGAPASDKFIRFMALAITIYMVVIDCYVVYSEHPRAHYLAYFTHWTLVLAFFYQVLACLVLFCPGAMISQPDFPKTEPGFVAKLMWSLYTLTINLQCMDAVWFWLCFILLAKSPDHDNLVPAHHVGLVFRYVTKHGGIGLLCWLDGTFLVGRIPIRLRQISIVYLVMFLYMIWTVIAAIIRPKISLEGQHWPIDIDLQSYIEDLDEYYVDNDEETVGSFEAARNLALIGWKETPLRACMALLLLMALVVPVNFMLHYVISLLLVRRPLVGEGAPPAFNPWVVGGGGDRLRSAAPSHEGDFRFQRMADGSGGGGGGGGRRPAGGAHGYAVWA